MQERLRCGSGGPSALQGHDGLPREPGLAAHVNPSSADYAEGRRFWRQERSSARISSICGSVGDEESLFPFLAAGSTRDAVGMGKLKECWKLRGRVV